MNDSTGRMLRSALQFIAGGGITTVVALVADGLDPLAATLLLAGSTLAVIVAQNFLEERGSIPAILKPKPVGEVVDVAGDTVGAVVGMTTAAVEGVAGTIIDDVGEIVGAVGPNEEETGE
jgi:hypothetical protein